LVLATVFAVAAVGKVRQPAATREMLRAFGGPPRLAPLLVAGEVAAVVLLLTVPVAGAALALALLGLFSAAIGRQLRAGRRPTCACFGALGAAPVSARTLGRNAAIAVPAVVLLVLGPGDDVTWLAALAVLAATAALTLLGLRPRRLPRGLRPPAGAPAAVIVTDPGCGPCVALRGQLGEWPAAMPLLVAGPEPGVDLHDPAGRLAETLGTTTTPAGVVVDARGRVASGVALGAAEIEALVRAWPAAPARHERTFEAFGVGFALAADDPAAFDRAVLPPGAREGGEPSAWWTVLNGADHVLYRDGSLAGRWADADALHESLESQIRMHVAEFAPEHSFVHSGVVAWKGGAIIVPGRSFTGKSTLTAALLRAGATYLSDEYAVIDQDGMVHPYVKPIALRENGGYVSTNHAVERFTELAPQDVALPLRAVVKAPYEAGATWEPRPVSAGTGVLLLLDNCVGVRRDPKRTMATLRRAVEGALILEGPRGEADETARRLLARLDAAASSTVPPAG
jgi:hypothetical protein